MRKRLTVEGKETKIIVVETIVAIDVPNKVESEKGEKRGERREREDCTATSYFTKYLHWKLACTSRSNVYKRGEDTGKKRKKKMTLIHNTFSGLNSF